MATEKPKTRNGKPKQPPNGANLGFEAEMFLAADKLRGDLEPSELQARRARPHFHRACLRLRQTDRGSTRTRGQERRWRSIPSRAWRCLYARNWGEKIGTL